MKFDVAKLTVRLIKFLSFWLIRCSLLVTCVVVLAHSRTLIHTRSVGAMGLPEYRRSVKKTTADDVKIMYNTK